MNKSTLLAVIIIAIVAIGGWMLMGGTASAPTQQGMGYKTVTYQVEGQPVKLGGTTQFFGNEARGDLNGDGAPDVAFLLTQQPGGSGTFYYVAVALAHADGTFTGTNAVLLGDRIAPQSTEIRDGQLIVNYADRNPGEPMTTQPSVGVSKYLHINGTKLEESS